LRPLHLSLELNVQGCGTRHSSLLATTLLEPGQWCPRASKQASRSHQCL